MKKTNLFIFIIFLSTGIIFSQSIKVTSPNGGENWKLGKISDILWNSKGISSPVGIKLFKNNISLGYIAQNVPNTGTFKWKISNVIGIGPIKPGSDYKIQVKISGVAGDISDKNFTISSDISLPKPSITITSPNGSIPWEINGNYNIVWKSTGISGPVGIKLFQNNVSLGYIAQNVPDQGTYNWKISNIIGAGNIKAGTNYKIQIKKTGITSGFSNYFTIISDTGSTKLLKIKLPPKQIFTPTVRKGIPNLMLTSQNIRFYSPKSDDTWKPLQTYKIAFDVMKKSFPHSNFNFRIKLMYAYATGTAFTITDNWLDPNLKRVDKSTFFTYEYTWKFQGSFNIKSGKYKIRVESMNNPSLAQDSQIFSVDSKISSGTGFLGESVADITVEDVYYDDYKQAFMARVKNTGFSTYNGPVMISYSLTGGQSTHASCASNIKISNQATKFQNETLGKFQVKTYKFMDWKCFALRSDNIPKNAPVKYDVSVYSNNQSPVVSGYLCKSKKPDIIASSPIFIHTKNNTVVRVGPGLKGTIHPNNFNWTSDTQFKTTISVDIWNWGCSSKTFDINLHMDGPYLNGKTALKLGRITLGPGQQKHFTSQPIIFSIPRGPKYQRFLLVAYQGEKSDEGYPNAYMNNFLLANIRIHSESTRVIGR